MAAGQEHEHRRRKSDRGDAGGTEPHRQLSRLALDIHDGPMQELVALGWGLGEIRVKACERIGDHAFLAAEFEELHAGLARVEAALRSMIRSPGEKSLVAADESAIVDAHIAAFSLRCPGVDVRVFTVGDVALETDSQRIALDRVLREALTNIAKHANATNVTVWLHGLRSSVLVQIRDDGKGFDTHESAGDGIGIAGMRERLELIGGKLTLTSAPGGPTIVSARIEKWRPPASAS